MQPDHSDRPRPMLTTGRRRQLVTLLLAIVVATLATSTRAQQAAADPAAPYTTAPTTERGSAWTAPAPEDLIIYHVFIDRFENGDPSNDSANPRTQPDRANPRGWHGGDLEGVRQRLGYIERLGANAIWLSPLTENVSAYHGYATYDWYNVEPNFGTMDELRRLIDEAHARGIAIYFDMVAGHMANLIIGEEEGWPAYRTPPDAYTMRWRDDSLRYPPPFDSPGYFHAHGRIPRWTVPEQELGELSDLDDLATDTPYVREEMTRIWSWWLRETRVDGFRIDTVKHVDRGFWEVFLPAIRRVAEEELGLTHHYTFGEIYGADDALMRQYVGELDGAPYKMDAALDFPFYYMAGGVFARADRPTVDFVNRLRQRAETLGEHHLMMPNFLDNHDVSRFMSVTEQAPASAEVRLRRLELGLVAMFAAPGPPIVYYGTEQGFEGDGDPRNRYDMFDGEFEVGAAEGDNFDETSRLYRLVARLGAARRASAPLRRGELAEVQSDAEGAGTLAFLRRHEGEAVLIVLNTAMTEAEFDGATVPEFAGERIANLLEPGAGVAIGDDGRVAARVLSPQAAEVWMLERSLPAPAAPGADGP